LFSNMLWFGKDAPLEAFGEVVDKVPTRLVVTLAMYAPNYFRKEGMRKVSPLGGISKSIPKHPLLELYNSGQLKEMIGGVEGLTELRIKKRFAAEKTDSWSMYIDPMLFNMPLPIGDRSQTVQDLPSALMGARFPVEGEKVRVFMQWGTGLPAQHLDMDLSCRVVYDNRLEYCSYQQLTIAGCKHSGDIQSIPEQVGTAEYIQINVPSLQKGGAKYVVFTCNAYTRGALSPNMVVGWMSCEHPMKISKASGVAYDPSCVQQMVRIERTLDKGLVFGVLDVEANEVIWLEMPFQGQLVQNMSVATVETMISQLDSKMSIGHLLKVKAEAQKLKIMEVHDELYPASEIYTKEWGMDSAKVSQLLLD
jgi:hypothetical protein